MSNDNNRKPRQKRDRGFVAPTINPAGYPYDSRHMDIIYGHCDKVNGMPDAHYETTVNNGKGKKGRFLSNHGWKQILPGLWGRGFTTPAKTGDAFMIQLQENQEWGKAYNNRNKTMRSTTKREEDGSVTKRFFH